MSDLPCRCDEKGCGHQMSWHKRVSTTEFRCGVPGCFCYVLAVGACEHACEHATLDGELVSASSFLSELGIAP